MCFEVKYGNALDLTPIESNETFIEVVLQEVLDLNHEDLPENLPEIIYDEYRISGLSLALIPAVLFFTWLVYDVLLRYKSLKHPIYLSKTICLPGYYSFLSRYRLF